MDNPEMFIAMCKECEECNPIRLKKGNRYFHNMQRIFIYGEVPNNADFDQRLFYDNVDTIPAECTWLPEIIQIKAMLKCRGYKHLIDGFDKITKDFYDYYSRFVSMEEKWLAYYMKYAEKRIWDFNKNNWIEK